MFAILNGQDVPPWLEPNSAQVLSWARTAFSNLELATNQFVKQGKDLFFFTWTGSRVHNTIKLTLKAQGLESFDNHICLQFPEDITPVQISSALREFACSPASDIALVTSAFGENIPPVGKYGYFLSNELRAYAYAAKFMDFELALKNAQRHISERPSISEIVRL